MILRIGCLLSQQALGVLEVSFEGNNTSRFRLAEGILPTCVLRSANLSFVVLQFQSWPWQWQKLLAR
jgi:hypothetical protein